MRHLIFSDMHSNLEGLQAVLAAAADKDYEAVMCLGDFVGYGANPNECVQTVAALPNMNAVLGNHDAAVIEPSQREFFNPVAKAAVVYSEDNLTPESRSFLEELPMQRTFAEEILFVHSSPHEPHSWIYVLDPYEARSAFDSMSRPIAFIGHTHYPVIHCDDGRTIAFTPGQKMTLTRDRKWLVNVGSAGQPRDGDPRAAFVIFDDQSNEVEIHRVEYDIESAASKILDAGLPAMLADRLRRGY